MNLITLVLITLKKDIKIKINCFRHLDTTHNEQNTEQENLNFNYL